MCRSTRDGGQRCAAHTRPAYEAATFGTPAWDAAAAEHASTPSGAVALTTALAQATTAENYDRAAALTTALRRGTALRAAAQETAQAVTSTHVVTDQQRLAVNAYTGRGNISFWSLNNKMRKRLPLTDAEQQVADTVTALAAATPTQSDATVFRGGARFDRLVGHDGMADHMTGKTFTDRSFASTTRDRAIMATFAVGTHKWEWEIAVPAGTPAVDVPALLGEDHEMAFQQELLLPPGTRYKITSDTGPNTVPRRLTLSVLSTT